MTRPLGPGGKVWYTRPEAVSLMPHRCHVASRRMRRREASGSVAVTPRAGWRVQDSGIATQQKDGKLVEMTGPWSGTPAVMPHSAALAREAAHSNHTSRGFTDPKTRRALNSLQGPLPVCDGYAFPHRSCILDRPFRRRLLSP